MVVSNLLAHNAIGYSSLSYNDNCPNCVHAYICWLWVRVQVRMARANVCKVGPFPIPISAVAVMVVAAAAYYNSGIM